MRVLARGLGAWVGVVGCVDVPDAPVDDVTAPEAVLEVVPQSRVQVEHLAVYGVFQLHEAEDRRPWLLALRADYYDTFNHVAPDFVNEGCAVWNEVDYSGLVYDSDLEGLAGLGVYVGDVGARLQAGLVQHAGTLTWAMATGSDAPAGAAIRLREPEAPLGAVPARVGEVQLTMLNPTAALGEAWQAARWTPAGDGGRLQIEIGDQKHGSTVICHADDDGMMVLPMVPDDIAWQFRASRVGSYAFGFDNGDGLMFLQSEVVVPTRADP